MVLTGVSPINMNGPYSNKNFNKSKVETFDWLTVQTEMKNKLGSDIYESWLKKISFEEEINNYILLSVPTRFIRDWITSRYLDQILQIIKDHKKDIIRIEFKIIEKNNDNIINNQNITNLTSDQKSVFRNKEIGFVYQFHHLLPELSTLENIALPALLSGKNRDQAYLKSRELLDQIGLKTKENNSPSELSGGERQRIAIARSMSNNPSCLIMDEPTGNLDSKNVKVFMDMLTDIIVENGTTLIIATHDQNVSSRLDRLLSLE